MEEFAEQLLNQGRPGGGSDLLSANENGNGSLALLFPSV